MLVTRRKTSEFKLEKSVWSDYLKQLLHFEKGQQENVHTLPEISLTLAMASLCATIQYMNLIEDPSNYGHYQIKLMNLNRFVHLDAAAVSALNLLPKQEAITVTSKANRWTSVQNVLDYCKTPQGHRLLCQWLKQPLRNAEIIKDRLDIVECFVKDPVSRQDLREANLKYIPDIMVSEQKN